MATEAMIIEGREKIVIVEENEAYLLGKNGRRRRLGTYAGMQFANTNSESEEAHIRVQAWVNPNYGLIRRAFLTTNINSPFLPAEVLMGPPTHTFKLAGPIHSHMVPVAKAA